ncbi:MAG: SRPBCC family protein [Hyphomonadaceae bacterium]|nr:SRPBCC family protein [Hyphomonadaceae bacterium]
MKIFDVQAIAIKRPADDVFAYVAEPANLPKWTNAFTRADATSADLATPNGALAIGLETLTSREARTVDWKMIMPDGSIGMAFSRITPDGDTHSIYSFVLMAPPVPLEMLEGALAAQIVTLGEELKKLRATLEA